jgi:hypothetical protein
MRSSTRAEPDVRVADLQDLERKILAFIDEWNQEAEPFNWTQKSFEKTLAKVDAALKAA